MWYIGVSGSDVFDLCDGTEFLLLYAVAYSVVFFFVFFLLWLDACSRNLKLHAPVKSITNWVSALLTAALVIVFVWYANGNYMALEYTKYHDFSYVQTLVTKIRSVEDYSQDKPVIVVGTQLMTVRMVWEV